MRVYKRTSIDLLKDASKSISGENLQESDAKNVKSEGVTNKVEKPKVKKVLQNQVECNAQSLSACQIIKNVIKTRMEMRKKKGKNVVSRLARRIVNINKHKIAKKLSKGRGNQKLVIDLNVNLKYCK